MADGSALKALKQHWSMQAASATLGFQDVTAQGDFLTSVHVKDLVSCKTSGHISYVNLYHPGVMTSTDKGRRFCN